MVTITGVVRSTNQTTNENFISLEVSGEPEMIQSANTGRFYLTSRKALVSCTFSEQIANTMIGKSLPGNIHKIPCEPYEYIVPETQEIITLSHTYEYLAEGVDSNSNIPSTRKDEVNVKANLEEFSTNGKHELVEA